MFDELTEVELKRITSFARVRGYKQDDTIFWESDPLGTVYVIGSGRVAIEREDELGRRIHVAHRGPGDVFGELSLFAEIPRTADVRVLEACEVAVIDGVKLDAMVDSSPGLARGVIRILAEKLRQTMERQKSDSQPALQRIAAYLVEAGRNGEVQDRQVILPKSVTVTQIAQVVGCTREHASRAIRELRGRKLISATVRPIILLNLSNLKKLADSEL